jgi:hypothetical protein
LMLNHAISRGPRQLKGPSEVGSGEFMQRYVFPDGEIVPLWQSLRAAEEVGFEVRDVEDLREHYAKTLRCWRRNLEEARDWPSPRSASSGHGCGVSSWPAAPTNLSMGICRCTRRCWANRMSGARCRWRLPAPAFTLKEEGEANESEG